MRRKISPVRSSSAPESDDDPDKEAEPWLSFGVLEKLFTLVVDSVPFVLRYSVSAKRTEERRILCHQAFPLQAGFADDRRQPT